MAANRVAKLVRALVQSVKLMSPAFVQEWKAAREAFSWKVDLRNFKDASKYQPGYFNRVIGPENVTEFEEAFRAELIPGGRVERAAEVVHWKNGGNFRARDRITRDLMIWIDGRQNWVNFASALKNLAIAETWESFKDLIPWCGQTSGFATPITFLSMTPKNSRWWTRELGSGGCNDFLQSAIHLEPRPNRRRAG